MFLFQIPGGPKSPVEAGQTGRRIDLHKVIFASEMKGTYRFHPDAIAELSMGGFDGEMRMHLRDLEFTMAWIASKGKKHSDGSVSVKADLLNPENTKNKDSLYNYAKEKYPKSNAEELKQFCKDVLQLVKEADDMRKDANKGKETEFFKST